MIEFSTATYLGLCRHSRQHGELRGRYGPGVALGFKQRYQRCSGVPARCKTARGARKDAYLEVPVGDWIVNFPTKRDWRERRATRISSGLNDLRIYLDELDR
jgi:hypothetical protein